MLLHVNEALVANVGDSRVVKATRSIDGHTNSDGSKKLIAVDWSKDQNASDEKERQRVIQSGGYITMPHEKGLPARIWLDKNCSQIGLAMSRSIGDHALKDVGVISEPEVKAFEINENDEVRKYVLYEVFYVGQVSLPLLIFKNTVFDIG